MRHLFDILEDILALLSWIAIFCAFTVLVVAL